MKRTMDEWLRDYRDYRESHGFSIVNIKGTINTFVNWCHRHYPDELYLTQEMIDAWSVKHDKEEDVTLQSRRRQVNDFIRHMNLRGEEFLEIECVWDLQSPPPRLITEEEFRNVLRAADEMELCDPRKAKYKASLILALQMPVIIRLMYSAGPRPQEIRYMDRQDVDLENGLIYIRKGKGYKERLIAIDWKVNEMLKEYDRKMQEIMPGCKPFFPNDKGQYCSTSRISNAWRKICDKYNKDTQPVNGKLGLVIYTLRHLYVTRNIEQLPQNGWEKDIRLLAISRSAGHVNINTTIKHYYHLTARSGDLLEEKMGDTLDSIIPDIED